MCIYLMNIFGDREIDIPPHSGQARSKIFRSPCQFLNGLFLRPPPPMLQSGASEGKVLFFRIALPTLEGAGGTITLT